MRWLQRLQQRLRSLFRRGSLEQELDDELAYHLERLIEQQLASGLTLQDARQAGLREMGGLEQRKEECRDARGWRWLDDLLFDLRFALRASWKSRSFSLVAVGSLALGIGVNTSIFSAVSALLLRRLPYPSPERLVWIDEQERVSGVTGVLDVAFVEWSSRSRTLEAIAGYSNADLTLTGVGEAEQLGGLLVTGGFFRALGTPMLHGRDFLPAELAFGGERTVILGHEAWQRLFAADPGVVGRSIRLNDQDHRVVGVLPTEFRFFSRRELWLPLTFDEKAIRGDRHQMLDVFARLRPGVTVEQARAELDTIKRSHWQDSPFTRSRLRLVPLHDYLIGGTRRFVLILFGAVVLVLLIACANVANLLLARAVVRQKQLAIRAALGAGRSRLLRQMLAESVLLALLGGACGLLVAWSLTRLLLAVSPPDTFGQIARVAPIGIDSGVLSFTLLASLVSGLLFGLAPALQFSRPDLTGALKEGGRGVSPRQHLHQALLVAQVALAVVLLVGAGLLIRSFVKLFEVEPGFRAENLLTLRFKMQGAPYKDVQRRVQLQRQLLETVAALPGVESAGTVTNPPLTGGGSITVIAVDGKSLGSAALGMASPNYFRVMGIRLRAGRAFDERDVLDAPPVLVVNESLARMLSPDRDLIGRQFPMPFLKTPGTVVGIVEDVRRQGLDRATRPEVFVPYQQMPMNFMTLAVRSTVAPRTLAAAVRKRVQALDANLPVFDVMTMEQRLAQSVAPRRFTLQLLGAFALLALLLASIGVYGVISYLVTQRTHEVGIRRALGARAADVLRLFLAQGMALGLVGVALGLFGALALTRAIASLLFGVSATDPLTFAGVSLLMALVVLAACWLPARRATGLDPLLALRHE